MSQYFVSVMSVGQKLFYTLLVLIWLAALVWFWHWWIIPSHIVTLWGFLITSFVLFWSTVIPGWFFYFAGRMKRPNPKLPLPAGRVAMVVTKAPSEPWEVVKKTLEAMKRQDYPGHFDVWLADEDPKQETISWCNANRVRISSRKNVPEYHQKKWPRRTKCKEGNLAYFYDQYGYSGYEFVSQMDADHTPEPTYLRHMIAPFIDPKIGYVAAPSICDANKDVSWTVRARLYAESGLHGSLQAGYNGNGYAPLCIGSHYAVRTQALKGIGGLGPELAEDHSTTLMMNNGGWNGAFALDAIAHGDGAASFSDSMTQEYQWSKSLMRIALEWMPKFSKKLTLKKKFQFLFSQWWYPLFAIQMVVAILSPTLAIFLGVPWVSVLYFDFLKHFIVLVLACLLPMGFIKLGGWFRPSNAPLISWESILFQIVRWPWSVLGCVNGFFNSLVPMMNLNFKVTPKGRDNARPLGLISILPYLFIIGMSGYAILALPSNAYVFGYLWLAILDIAVYTIALAIVVLRHIRENLKNIWATLSAAPGVVIVLISSLLFYQTFSITPFPKSAIAATPSLYPATFVGVRQQIGPTPQPTGESFVQIVATAIPVFPTATPSPIIALPENKFLTGIYDPAQSFSQAKFDIQHYFTDWNYPEMFDQAIQSAQNENQFPMVTVQPFHKPELDPHSVLADITAGKYDDLIIAMATTLNKHAPQQVIIRWGHEMDLCQVYDWSNCAPGDFIPAFQHVVDLNRSLGVTNALWMWSPAGGNPNTPSFYPGDTYVDFIGVTGLVSEDWDRYYGYSPQPRFFAQRLNEVYGIAETFHKPLIVAELGISYSDPNVNRTQWLTDAFAVMKDREQFPFLIGWVYFNEFTQPNPHIATLPDFRITLKELYDAFSNVGGF